MNIQRPRSIEKYILVLVFGLLLISVILISRSVYVSKTSLENARAAVLVTPTVAPGTVLVDPGSDIHPISPFIYGISNSGPSSAEYTTFHNMGVTVLRWGGNARTRYNWEISASNSGSDSGYCNQSKNTVTSFVNGNRGIGADSLLTIPIIGWVAKNTGSCSSGLPGSGGDALIPYPTPGWETGSISGYNPTTNRNNTSYPSYPRKGSPFSLTPTPGDNQVFQDEWVNSIKAQYGPGGNGGVRFYDLDNESDLWADETHLDVHPARLGYDEELYRIIQYADAIKDVDSTAQIFTPVSWDYPGYWYSARDQFNGNTNDYSTHGNVYHLNWLLRNIRAHDQQTGRRSIDVVDMHWYPQNGVVPGSETQATLRLQLPRGLWDTSYAYPGFLGGYPGGSHIAYIPNLQLLINQEYPGTKMAITEWNFGSEGGISGGLAAGDVLGIYGREGLYLATMWPYNDLNNTPIYYAWRMYRNYDGSHAVFGDTSIKAQSSALDVDKFTVYGSRDSATNELKVMFINKQASTTMPLTVNFNNYSLSGSARVYEYSAAHSGSINRLADIPVSGTSLTYTLPPYSMTLIVIPSSAGGTPPPTSTPTPTNIPPTPTLPVTATPTPTVDLRRADVNRNGVINSADFNYFRSEYRNGGRCTSSTNCADIDCDGDVDMTDYGYLQSVFGTTVNGQAPVCPYFLLTPSPSTTPTPTPSGGQTTITFDSNLGGRSVESTLNGQYPAGVIDWGSNNWYLSGPYNVDSTNSVTFNGGAIQTASFTLPTPKKLVSIKAFGNSGTTLTLSCSGNPTITATTVANQMNLISTGWTQACTQVTIHSDNGWTTNFDDLVIQ